jgi:molybdopterin-containing oxidoreductase family membrane subunit
VIPGFVPDVLGDFYEYAPTGTEMLVTIGIWATGLLVFTLLLRIAVPIMNGDFHVSDDGVNPHIGDQLFLVRRRDVVPEEDLDSP